MCRTWPKRPEVWTFLVNIPHFPILDCELLRRNMGLGRRSTKVLQERAHHGPVSSTLLRHNPFL